MRVGEVTLLSVLGTLLLLLGCPVSCNMRVCAKSYHILLGHIQLISVRGLLFFFSLKGNEGRLDLRERLGRERDWEKLEEENLW